jgi:threonine/homoserine/homoserine lactone efflux protein
VTSTLFIALFIFAAIAAWTPGPNNTLLMASGVNHGFRQTVPLVLGVAIGFPFMIGVVGLGIGKIFDVYPSLYTILKYAGAAYMIWLAFKIATSKRPEAGELQASQPLTFMQGSLFQWINPKGWMMALTMISSYTLPTAYWTGLATIVATALLMGFTSASAWALFGSSLRHVMNDPRYFRIINIALAASLLASIVPMLRH